jgi:glycosyltransferase involved in cell wall biosynthesis
MFVANCGSGDRSVTAFSPPMDFRSRLRRVLRKELIWRDFVRYQSSRPPGYDSFTDDRSEHSEAPLSQLPLCEVINLHWVAGFIDYQSFFSLLPRDVSIVWTLHDMNPFTGGCHYSESCSRYTRGCGACPQLGSDKRKDLSHRIWKRKQRAFAELEPDRLHLVTPSIWLAEEAKRSPLVERFPISSIPHGINTEVFSPKDPSIARAALDLPQNAKVVLFIAVSTATRRKGFEYLAEALSDLQEMTNLCLVSLGHGKPTIHSDIAHLHLGHIDDDQLLSLIYSSAEVFAIPSIEDNLPNCVIESMSCGTPVVGFEVGGIPEMVRPGVTGLLAPPQDVKALGAAIIELLQDPAKRDEMAAHCRRVAHKEYSYQVQVRRYVDLYETILGEQV